jgi:hypothetical protein
MKTDWLRIFKLVSPFVSIALGIVEKNTDDKNVDLAIKWVRVAMNTASLPDGAARREFVVKTLVARGLSENVARMLVEIAVAVVKEQMSREKTA